MKILVTSHPLFWGHIELLELLSTSVMFIRYPKPGASLVVWRWSGGPELGGFSPNVLFSPHPTSPSRPKSCYFLETSLSSMTSRQS